MLVGILLLEMCTRQFFYKHSSTEAAIEFLQTQENNCDTGADNGQMSTGVEILLKMSHNKMTSTEEYIQ
jgi:hypothetical protein